MVDILTCSRKTQVDLTTLMMAPIQLGVLAFNLSNIHTLVADMRVCDVPLCVILYLVMCRSEQTHLF